MKEKGDYAADAVIRLVTTWSRLYCDEMKRLQGDIISCIDRKKCEWNTWKEEKVHEYKEKRACMQIEDNVSNSVNADDDIVVRYVQRPSRVRDSELPTCQLPTT
ncbi:MAG: hypothetical protein J6Y29_02595 [Clostridiales bacterium]|nr:hypothetical protein [Clostridiales bacterium]